MSFRFFSGDLEGIEGRVVEVEVDLIPALSSFVISGLPGKGIREARERIRSALENSGFRYPDRHRIVVNLAPASWEKDGAVFDLPIALSILAASGQIPEQSLHSWAAIGELALDGRLRKVPGCLGILSALRSSPRQSVVVPVDNSSDAEGVSSIHSVGACHLREAIAIIVEGAGGARRSLPPAETATAPGEEVDLADVRGHHHARRALEVAAAGEHPLLMVGPPGSGKSFLACRLPSILPPLDGEERLEVTQIHDVCRLQRSTPVLQDRPFRSPHHSISWAGLIGGGSPPIPGEVTLAHRGVLFLDEFPEIQRRSLEALREPLEAGEVTISRSRHATTFPAHFLLVAAMNPCPCGGQQASPGRRGRSGGCRCSTAKLAAYRSRVSGPLLDRFDIRIGVEAISSARLFDTAADRSESSRVVRSRVEAARRKAMGRGQQRSNRQLEWKHRQRWAPLSDRARQLMIDHAEQKSISTRGLTRLLRLGRTIADLRGADDIEEVDLIEALSLRGGGWGRG